ncbi:protein-glutamine gamma-glutamyltransferase 2a [Pristis pectinata]|uniref:protein-glutamine gamma-glutamyltransferase 2a n=1 Tax=Pristis pectinata TaxID=685728 RepID=UPI00223DDEA0|nr:protein-glutamine gamma-glutamyltransferase 2a [Pristis pectinata]
MAQALEVASTDLQCQLNNTAHNTADFGFRRLVLRRGARFTITVKFTSRGYQPQHDQISFIVETVLDASEASEKVEFQLSSSVTENSWSAALGNNAGSQLTLSMCSPSTSKIGRFSLKMVCTTQGYSRQFHLGEFIILFNPWCSADAVFLASEDQRREYVLNDQGLTYYGTNKNISSLPWNFGQFEDGILDICLKILDNSKNYLENPKEDCSKRNDPVYISRLVTAMVNCNDDRGILQGRWDGNYSHGTAPTTWIGSISILRRWSNSGCQPVLYGQCWVFAAVACTVLRCFGIATRHITNFNSAHDTEQDLRIDSFSDENGRTLNIMKDSVWNFHCWVESWMTRPDLKAGYDGWQVLDPTPQERSEGIFCCGPASLKAIKNGDVNLNFDTPFVFAEVNADMVSWLVRKDGSRTKIDVNSRLIGQFISTKAVGSDDREDVTHNYKYPEGSEEERNIFHKANKSISLPNEPKKPFSVKLNANRVNVNGSNFEASFVVSNQSSETKNCRLLLCAQTTTYNGKPFQECGWKDLENFTIGPQEAKTETLQVKYTDYSGRLTDHNQICITGLVIEYNTYEVLVAKKVITMQNPELQIKILGEPVQYRDMTAEICFTNPLPENVCDGFFLVEGAGLTEEQRLPCPVQSIGPGQEVKIKAKFTPQKSGQRKLLVDFDCNKLKDVKGSKTVIIKPYH